MTSVASGSHNIIGGLFGLEKIGLGKPPVQPAFMDSGALRMVNARSCIYFALLTTHSVRIWLPSFLCPAVIEAGEAAGCQVCFYPVDKTLQIADDHFLNKLQPSDAFLFINYFGFPGSADIASRAQDLGAIVIEDASQSLLSPPAMGVADFAVFSPRKFLGVADGGILRSKGEFLDLVKEFEQPPMHWIVKAYQAAEGRANFDSSGSEGDWFGTFKWAESNAPIGRYRMSEKSVALLYCAFDYDDVAAKRRRNFLFLLEAFPESALFNQLPKDVTPLGFPLVIKGRELIQTKLADEHIYAPVHWRIESFVPAEFAESHDLSSNILTVPCDQRYDLNDMARVVKALRSVGVMK